MDGDPDLLGDQRRGLRLVLFVPEQQLSVIRFQATRALAVAESLFCAADDRCLLPDDTPFLGVTQKPENHLLCVVQRFRSSMEFFEEVERQGVDVEALKDLLQISTLPSLCSSIDSVISENHNGGEIYCVWGQFNISREVIRNGVRFALLDCPHAFVWTITHHGDRSMLVVHCTIDDREEDKEFIETIKQFASDWGLGLGNALPEIT